MVKASIKSVNMSLNRYMNEIGLSPFAIRLTAPEHVVELIEEIRYRISDEDSIVSELDAQGLGVQSLAVTASMLWQQLYVKNKRNVI
jgi:hypothetical protein